MQQVQAIERLERKIEFYRNSFMSLAGEDTREKNASRKRFLKIAQKECLGIVRQLRIEKLMLLGRVPKVAFLRSRIRFLQVRKNCYRKRESELLAQLRTGRVSEETDPNVFDRLQGYRREAAKAISELDRKQSELRDFLQEGKS